MSHPLRAAVIQKTSPQCFSSWETGSNTAFALGISERTLARWRSSGLLKPGTHWRRKFPNQNSPVLYDIPAVDTLMRELAARDFSLLETIEGA
jgi:hypothetical protein